jgi:hypothetical protein
MVLVLVQHSSLLPKDGNVHEYVNEPAVLALVQHSSLLLMDSNGNEDLNDAGACLGAALVLYAYERQAH